MKLHDLELTKALKDENMQVKDVLQKYGWKLLGFGLGGAVAQHPNESYVLKIFANDDGYTHYVEFVKQNQSNIHVPKINAYTRSIPGTKYSYVRMEKLAPLTEAHVMTTYFPEIAYMVVLAAKNDVLMTDAIEEAVFKDLKKAGVEFDVLRHVKFDDMWNKLKKKPDAQWLSIVPKLIYFADDNPDAGYLDIHDGNFMMRNGTLVITDPF